MFIVQKIRVVGAQAFQPAGVGLCGSVYTKIHPKSKEMTKNYISITTCESSRMIHLEILPDQSTEDLLHNDEFQR